MDADLAYEPRARRLAMGSPIGPGEIAYLDYGPQDRPPDLVFLHANGFNARAYRTILAPLARSLRFAGGSKAERSGTRLGWLHRQRLGAIRRCATASGATNRGERASEAGRNREFGR